MLKVETATNIVLENTFSFGEETVPLAEADGRVLRENLLADRDFPPFDRSAMDGIAIHSQAFQNGQRTFPITGLQAAGVPQQILDNQADCMEVMTGAMVPEGADSVVRYEDTEIADGQATVILEEVKAGQNIHKKSADRRVGELAVPAGRLISPAEIGVAATVGKVQIRVARLPKTALISTGDELVDVEETPLPHQIRKSNVHQLAAALGRWGIVPTLLHLPDDAPQIKTALQDCLQNFDVLLLSGGVSMGKLDFVPEVLEELGVKKLFHKVQQRPGKPFWFGRTVGEGVRPVAVFALPGNPVSTFVCTHRYFRPWLRASLGLQPFDNQYAVLETDFWFKPDLTYFLQIKTAFGKDGRLLASPIEGGGSGDLANLTEADAFMELPLGRSFFEKGEVFPVWFYRPIANY